MVLSAGKNRKRIKKKRFQKLWDANTFLNVLKQFTTILSYTAPESKSIDCA